MLDLGFKFKKKIVRTLLSNIEVLTKIKYIVI